MRSQRVKRIKRSKKSKMSKRIQRTKRLKRLKRTKKTKRTKRKKRTQINRRKKTLKGGMKRLFSGLGFGGTPSRETDPDLEAERAYAQRVAAEAEAAQRALEKKDSEKQIIAGIINDWLTESFDSNKTIPKRTILGDLTRLGAFETLPPGLKLKFNPSEGGPLVTQGLIEPWEPASALTFGNKYDEEIFKIFKQVIEGELEKLDRQ